MDQHTNNGPFAYADTEEYNDLCRVNSSVILLSSSTEIDKDTEGVLNVNGWAGRPLRGVGEMDEESGREWVAGKTKEEATQGGPKGGIQFKVVEAANKGYMLWMAMLVLCMCPLGGYLAYDVPGALNINLKEERGLTLTQIGALYTAYAIPTVISSPFCGFIIQIFGAHKLLVVCNAMLAIGSLGFAFANSYGIMIFTRVLFGAGAEILFVAGAIQIEQWFRHSKYLGFAFGASSCFPLIGTIGAFAVLPTVSTWWSLRAALLVATGFVVFSTVMASVYAFFVHPHLKFAREEDKLVGKVSLSGVAQAVRGIRKEFWLVGVYVFTIYTTGFSFLAVAGRFLNEKYGYSDIDSSWLITIFCGVAFVFGPILGIGLDKIRRRVTVSIIAGFLNAIIYFIFGFTSAPPLFLLIISAMVFVTGSSTTLCLTSQFATGRDIGILFSLLSVFQNLTFLTMPVVFGAIRDATGGYEWSFTCFGVICILGTLSMVWLRFMKVGEELDAGPKAHPPQPHPVELKQIDTTSQ